MPDLNPSNELPAPRAARVAVGPADFSFQLEHGRIRWATPTRLLPPGEGRRTNKLLQFKGEMTAIVDLDLVRYGVPINSVGGTKCQLVGKFVWSSGGAWLDLWTRSGPVLEVSLAPLAIKGNLGRSVVWGSSGQQPTQPLSTGPEAIDQKDLRCCFEPGQKGGHGGIVACWPYSVSSFFGMS